jgi:hypothetical protein
VLTTSCVCVYAPPFSVSTFLGETRAWSSFLIGPGAADGERQQVQFGWLAGWLALTPSPFLPSSHGDTLPRSGQPSSNPSICIHIDRYTRSVEHTRKTLGQGEQQRRKSAREPKRGAFSR